MEKGEKFDKALERELKEETGVRMHIDGLISVEQKTFLSPKK